MSLSWKFFMVSVFQLVLCLQAILTHLIFGSVFNGDSIQKLSLLLLSPAGWIAKQFQSSCIFFFFHLQIPSILYFESIQGRFDKLKDDRAVVSQGDIGLFLFYYCLFRGSSGWWCGNYPRQDQFWTLSCTFFCHLYFSLKNLNATFMFLSLQAVWMYLSSYLSFSIPEFKNSFLLNY